MAVAIKESGYSISTEKSSKGRAVLYRVDTHM